MSIAQLQANKQDVVTGKRITQKERIYKLLCQGLPMTFEHVVKATNFKNATVVGRLSELSSEGRIIENEINNLSYYSPTYSDELRKKIIQDKAEKRTQRVLKALLNDDKAMEILVLVYNDDYFERLDSVKIIKNRINIHLK